MQYFSLENENFQEKIKNINFHSIAPLFDNQIGIVLAVDENYINYLCVTIESLQYNCSIENDYDIVILFSYSNDFIQNEIIQNYSKENFSIRFIDISYIINYFDDQFFYICNHFTIAMYYRFFIPSIFKNYKKIIYLDCDAILLDDISSLYTIDLKENLLGVVLDTEIQRMHFLKNNEWSKNFINYLKNDLTLKKSENYFQSGFIIFNIQKCLEFNLMEKCLIALKNIKTPMFPDQDILNKVTEEKVYYLDLSWNVENHIMVFNRANLDNFPKDTLEQYLKSLKEVKFLHFSGCIKPWQDPTSYNAHLWWHYARQTPFYE
ncbi:TPA: glycosyltransferase family 8 protein, partial [Campylobacter jejuni]|nr:glycosyltransferase family 8 protein [Campylobacter jejuni]